MATKKTAEVEVKFAETGLSNLQKPLDEVLRIIQQLPQDAKEGSTGIREIADQVVRLANAVKTVGFNAAIGEAKALGAALKTISTLQKGAELFSNKDIENINAASTAIRQAARAYDTLQRQSQIKSGTFGLDATKVSEVTKSIKTLETELKAVEQTRIATGRLKTSDPLFQQGLAISSNIKSLQNLQGELQRTFDLQKQEAAFIAQQKVIDQQFQSRQSGRIQAADVKEKFENSPVGQTALVNKQSLTNDRNAQLADPAIFQAKAAQDRLRAMTEYNRIQRELIGLDNQDLNLSRASSEIRNKILGTQELLSAELIRTNKQENDVTEELRRQVQVYNAQLSAQKRSDQAQANPSGASDAVHARAQNRLGQLSGEGGAALIAVQAVIQAQYSILNGITGAITAAIGSSVQLEAAFKNVQAVTATTRTEMVGLEDTIKSVATGSRFSAVEIANAALVLGQAGLSAKQITESLPAVVTLATAAGATLETTVDLVTSIIGVFDKTASDTTDIANKITAAANSSKVSVDKLSLAFQYVGNTAAQTGVSFEETTAALAAMSNAGITSGSTLGTGLRHFLTEVEKPSEEFLASLRRVGLAVSDIDIRSHGLVGVITKLREAGFVASDAIKSFDIRSASAFNGLIANPQALQDQLDGLNNSQAALKANEIQMQSLDSQSKRLTNSLQVTVSTGLTPLQTVLTQAASALANLFGFMNQFPGVMSAVTTAIAGFIALELAAHISGLIAGFGTLTGVTGGITGVFRTLTSVKLLDVEASIRAAFANQALAASELEVGAAAGVAATGMGVLEAVMYGVGRAVGFVVTVVRGLSLLTGIGLVLGAVATALYFMDSAATKAKDTVDKLKASTDSAKGAFDEKTTSVNLLQKKIEELEYKQTSLIGNQKELDSTARALAGQFGNIGFQADANNNSYTVMIGKLRTLKSEMQGIAGVKLDLQIKTQQELLQEQTKQAVEAINTDVVGAPRQSSRLSQFVGQSKILDNANVTDSQKKVIQDALGTLSDARSSTFLTGANGDKNLQALLRVTNALDIISKNISPDQKRNFDSLAKPIYDAVIKASDVAQTKQEVAQLRNTKANTEEDLKFRASPIFTGGKTFEQALPTFESSSAKALAANPNLKADDLELAKKVHDVATTAIDQVDGVIKQLKDNQKNIDPEAYKKALADAGIREEQIKSDYNSFYANVQSTIKLRIAAEDRLAKVTGDAYADATGKLYSKDERKANQAAAARKIGQNKEFLATAGFVGKDERSRALGDLALEEAEQRAKNIEDKPARETADQAYKKLQQSIADAYLSEAKDLEAKAKGAKISATNSDTVEQVEGFLEAGIADLTKAKADKLLAKVAEQNIKTKPGSKERTPQIELENARALAALADEADQEIENFYTGASGIFGAVAKKGNRLGSKADLEGKQQNLARLKDDAEANLFNASRPLAQDAIDVASGKLIPDSTQQKIDEVRITAVKLKDLGDQLSVYTDLVTSLQAAVDNSDGRIQDLKNQIVALPDGDIRKAGLQSQLGEAYNDKKQYSSDLSGAVKGKFGIQTSIDQGQATLAGQLKAIPLDFNTENIEAKLKKVGDDYAQTIKNFDGVKSIGDGVAGVLGGLAGSFADIFTSIETGSMSAGQAFKQFAIGIIKQMLNIINQALAMAAIKAVIGLFSGGGEVGTSSPSGSASAPVSLLGLLDSNKAADGGHLMGGTPGKDSIPVLAMPGEYILKKAAVDAVGVDYLHGLNNQTANSLNTATAGMSTRSNSAKAAGETTNIWVVTPDQKPGSFGPKDAVIAVQDSLNQGQSSLKTLVKTIAAGQA